MLLKSCCGILRWQLKFHNHSWLHHCFYILLGLVWYLFCKHHPCLLGLVTVWTSFWVPTFCSKVLLICIFCVLLHPCPAAWVPPLPHCIPQGTLAGEKLWGPWAPQAGAVTGTPPLPTRTCQLSQWLLPIPGSLKDILASVFRGEQLQLQQKVEKVSLIGRNQLLREMEWPGKEQIEGKDEVKMKTRGNYMITIKWGRDRRTQQKGRVKWGKEVRGWRKNCS